MAKFITIPTQVVGQPIILFNTDNITSVTPPPANGTTVFNHITASGKEFRLTFGGSTAAIQNTNAITASNIINNAVTNANAAPVNFPVNFPSTTLTAGSGAGTTITVASTAGLIVGSVVTVISSLSTGQFALNTTVSSITNGTQFVVSAAPTTALSGATISAAPLTVTAITVV